MSFTARLLGTLHGNLFCYSAISSAGVVLILPGFTIRECIWRPLSSGGPLIGTVPVIAALELTSRNILCGSVRMVYAIIYTLFLVSGASASAGVLAAQPFVQGFGLTIGSDFYLLVSPQARRNLAATNLLDSQVLHGFLIDTNTTASLADLGGTFTFLQSARPEERHVIKGCYRDPAWPWYRQPFPWWTMLFLVPVYSTCSSVGNLQALRSVQLPVMVAFSCAAYAANRAANTFISDRTDIVSASGAFVIGLCGNVYSRVVGGTAFTSMVTGVLFLVPVSIRPGLLF